MTETWANSYCDVNVPYFEHFVLNRTQIKRNSKRASGGIIVYIRNEFVSKDTLVFTCEDDILCVKICRDKLYLEHDLYLCLCYVVPEQSSRQSMIGLDTFDRLLNYIVHLDHEKTNIHLVICGDMNAHTSDCADFLPDENIRHADYLPDDYSVDQFCLPRCSLDRGRAVNSNGRNLLDLCKPYENT